MDRACVISNYFLRMDSDRGLEPEPTASGVKEFEVESSTEPVPEQLQQETVKPESCSNAKMNSYYI